MPAPILDTHAWIWWVQADPRLDRRTVAALVASCRVLGHPLLTRDRAIASARLVRRWTPSA